MATDPFSREYDRNLANPASSVFLISPDSDPLDKVCKSLRIWNPAETAITVTMKTDDGETITLSYPPGLTIEPVRATHVTAATAGTIIHGYSD